jgi:hypothetical protein
MLYASHNALISFDSVFDNPNLARRCSDRRLGYTIPPSITSLIAVPPDIINAVLKALLVILVLHPIAAALALIALFFSLFLSSHGMTIVALIFTLLSALLSSLVWATDLAIVAVARQNIKTVSGFHFRINFGTAIWMVLVAVILTWTALVLLAARACYCCGVRRWASCLLAVRSLSDAQPATCRKDLEPDVPVVESRRSSLRA